MDATKSWRVYFIENCHDCEKYNQGKLFVPIYHEKEILWGTATIQWWGFYINSFRQNLEALQVCDVVIVRSDHPFLSKDSWINVNEIHKYPDSTVVNERGIIAGRFRQQILQAILSCPLLERKHKNNILESEKYSV